MVFTVALSSGGKMTSSEEVSVMRFRWTTSFIWTNICAPTIYSSESRPRGTKVSVIAYMRILLLTIIHSVVTGKGSNTLLSVTSRKLIWPILAVVPPRLCLIAFNFCQPFLIDRAIRYSEQADRDPHAPNTANVGYGLIGAYVLVYIGIAVRCAPLIHALNITNDL